MDTAQPQAIDDPRRLAMALGRVLGLDGWEVDLLTQYLRRLDAIEHELRHLQAAQRAPGQPIPHEGPGTWREPHPIRAAGRRC